MNSKPPFNLGQMLSLYWWECLFFKISGGRPMIDEGYNFTDVVSGKPVRNYTDRFGRKWMADSGPWSLFRVSRGEIDD